MGKIRYCVYLTLCSNGEVPEDIHVTLERDWNFQMGGGEGVGENPFCGRDMNNCWNYTSGLVLITCIVNMEV